MNNIDDQTRVKVVNRTNNTVGYSIPDMQNLHRNYTAKEEKIITFGELRSLSYVPGGMEIIKNYLVIKDPDVIKALNINIEPEYYYDEKEIINLMQNGSLDEFLDCLDFAPDGVLDLIKEISVKLPLNDVIKRKAIFDKLGFNVDKAIDMKEEEDAAGQSQDHNASRRVSKAPTQNAETKELTTSTRRVVVTKES